MELTLERRPTAPPAPVTERTAKRPDGFSVALAVVVLVAAALRAYALDARPLWIDEGISLSFAQQGFPRVASLTDPVDTSSPPGYYTLLWFWQLFSVSEWWLRLLSALLGAVTVAFTGLAARNLAGRAAGIVAAVVLAVLPYHIQQSQTVRMYTLVTAGAAVMLWVVTWVARHPTHAAHPKSSRWIWTAYAAASIVVLYAHNTGIITVTAMVLVFAVYWITGRRDPRVLYHFIITQVAALLAWLPFSYGYVIQAINVFGGVESGQLIVTESWYTTLRNMWFPYVITEWRWLFEVGLLALFLYGLWTVRDRPRWLALLALAPIFGIALLTAAHQLIPIFTARAVIWTLIPGAIAAAIGITRLPRWAGGLSLVVLAIPVTIGLTTYYTKPAQANFEMLYDPWPEAASYVEERVGPADVVLFSPGYIEPTFDYYYTYDDQTLRTDVITAASVSRIEDLVDDVDDVWVVRTADRAWDQEGLLGAALSETRTPTEVVRIGDIQLQRFVAISPPPTSSTLRPEPALSDGPTHRHSARRRSEKA